MAMRIIPISMLAWQAWHMMYAMRCQTSVNFQGGAAEDGADVLFHAIGKAGSFWLDDRAVCEAIGMIPDAEWIDTASTAKDPEDVVAPPKGSLDILWPLYKTLSLSQFVEVFCCSLGGSVPAAETGMTLLEHSLAFAEAEAQATRKTYRLETAATTNSTKDAGNGENGDDESEEADDTKSEVKIFKIKGEKLVPTEVLYISTISAMSHITSHVLAIFKSQTRYRLFATSFYGMAFLSGFAVALRYGGATGILDFPTISVVGFIPHLLIFAAISGCGLIYGMALVVSSLINPSGRISFSEGFNNMRANHTVPSTIAVSLGDDFYTVLLKFGYVCLTAAAEATYLNEGRAVRLPAVTWLEGERQKLLDHGSAAGRFEITGKGGGPFAMERKDFSGVVDSAKDSRRPFGGRWISAGELMRGVVAVVSRWALFVTARLLHRTTTDAGPEAALSFSDIDEMDDEDYAPSEDGSASPPSSSEDEDEGSSRYSREQSVETHRSAREATPLLDPMRLAALLDPQSPEDRASARLLARHLVAPAALTRQQYSATQLSGTAEEAALENILLHRRCESSSAETETDADSGGPLCVVCQSEPRTVIVWPCRCLSLCEDCRVCLAMNNWSSCVTCRVKCEGYSRVYVP